MKTFKSRQSKEPCKEWGQGIQGLPDRSFCESLVDGNLVKSSTDNAEDKFVFWILYFQHQIVWLRINYMVLQ